MSTKSKRVKDGIDLLRRAEWDMARFLKRSRGRWFSSWELAEAWGLRFGARIHSLRKAGLKIETKRTGPATFKYRMTGLR